MLITGDRANYNHITDCLDKNLFEGKRVLEVGGSLPEETVSALKVKCWDCVDPVFENTEMSDFYSRIKASILDYEPVEPYDLIIATNSFEHILGLEKGLENMYRILNKGGKLSSLLGPVWSCYKGHHIWYPNGDGTFIDFNNVKLPDWAHLIYSEKELIEILSPNYSEKICDSIIFQIKGNNFCNRMFYDDYAQIVNNSDFKKIEFRDWHTSKYPDENLQKRLEKQYGRKNFSTVSIKMILEK